jgi:hypothetical protein
VAECLGAGVPVVVVPFLNQALAARRPLQAAVEALRAEGVRVLLGPGGVEPHPIGQGGSQLATFPWSRALDHAEALTRTTPGA